MKYLVYLETTHIVLIIHLELNHVLNHMLLTTLNTQMRHRAHNNNTTKTLLMHKKHIKLSTLLLRYCPIKLSQVMTIFN